MARTAKTRHRILMSHTGGGYCSFIIRALSAFLSSTVARDIDQLLLRRSKMALT